MDRTDILPFLQSPLEPLAVLLASICDMHCNVVSEFLRDLLEGESGRLRKVEVYYRKEDCTPANHDQEVFPHNLREANWCRLEKNDRRRELSKKTESHSDRSDLRREDLRDPEIHRGVAARALESEVKEDEEDAEAIADLIRGTRVLGDHRRKTSCGDEAASCPDHEHPSSGVDSVVQPCTSWVVDEASSGKPESTQEEWLFEHGRSISPLSHVVSHIFWQGESFWLHVLTIAPVWPRLV